MHARAVTVRYRRLHDAVSERFETARLLRRKLGRDRESNAVDRTCSRRDLPFREISGDARQGCRSRYPFDQWRARMHLRFIGRELTNDVRKARSPERVDGRRSEATRGEAAADAASPFERRNAAASARRRYREGRARTRGAEGGWVVMEEKGVEDRLAMAPNASRLEQDGGAPSSRCRFSLSSCRDCECLRCRRS